MASYFGNYFGLPSGDSGSVVTRDPPRSKAYCTRYDVEDIWSEEGVESRYDDDHDASLDARELDVLDRTIVRASVRVGSKIRNRFREMSAFQGSNPPVDTPDSIRYITAVVAAYYSSYRRGNPVPEELRREYEEVMQLLDEIAAGKSLPLDLQEQIDGTPFTSNFVIDGSYRTSKARTTRPNSTRDEPSSGIRRARELFYGFPWE